MQIVSLPIAAGTITQLAAFWWGIDAEEGVAAALLLNQSVTWATHV